MILTYRDSEFSFVLNNEIVNYTQSHRESSDFLVGSTQNFIALDLFNKNILMLFEN